MKNLMLVGLGGFVGSVARYLMSGWLLQLTAPTRFPYGTLSVNVLGCFAAGVLAGLGQRYQLFGSEARLLLFVGFLGGFTTFSAFGLETIALLRRGETLSAAAYVIGSVVLGLAAVWVGLKCVPSQGQFAGG